LYQKLANVDQTNQETNRVYFVEKLINFLPEENDTKENNSGSANLLRPELLQDD
jgi:hypothetical protein